MLIGAWLNGIGWVPSAFVQGQGRPDLTAKIHVIELLPFLGLLWAGIHYMGVTGAAAAVAFRMALDTGLLIFVAEMTRAVALRLLSSILFILVAFAVSVMAGEHLTARILLGTGFGLGSLLVAHATSPEAAQIVLREARIIRRTGKDGAVV
jgi:O-antigen/teichoic acid export membrane protein